MDLVCKEKYMIIARTLCMRVVCFEVEDCCIPPPPPPPPSHPRVKLKCRSFLRLPCRSVCVYAGISWYGLLWQQRYEPRVAPLLLSHATQCVLVPGCVERTGTRRLSDTGNIDWCFECRLVPAVWHGEGSGGQGEREREMCVCVCV